MKRKYDITATVGKYTDSYGKEKNRYIKIGTVFERPDGSLCAKFETFPVGNEWNGWTNFYEPKIGDKEFNEAKQSVSVKNDLDDEIPF